MWKRPVQGADCRSEGSHSSVLVLCFSPLSPPSSPLPFPVIPSAESGREHHLILQVLGQQLDSLFIHSLIISRDGVYVSGPVKPVTHRKMLDVGTGLSFRPFLHIWKQTDTLHSHFFFCSGEMFWLTAFFEHYLWSSAQLPISDWIWSLILPWLWAFIAFVFCVFCTIWTLCF